MRGCATSNVQVPPRGAAQREMRSASPRLALPFHEDFLFTSPQPAPRPVTEQFSKDGGGQGPGGRHAWHQPLWSSGLRACMLAHAPGLPWRHGEDPSCSGVHGSVFHIPAPSELRCPVRAHEHPCPHRPARWRPSSPIACVSAAWMEALFPPSSPETTLPASRGPRRVRDGAGVALFNSPFVQHWVLTCELCLLPPRGRLPEGGSCHVLFVFQALASPQAVPTPTRPSPTAGSPLACSRGPTRHTVALGSEGAGRETGVGGRGLRNC